MKSCSKCGKKKRLSEFHRSRGARDGRKSQCGECARAEGRVYVRARRDLITSKNRAWRDANRAHVRDHDKDYYAKSAERHKSKMAVWRSGNREKLKAQRLLNVAVLSGTLVRPKACSACGAGDVRINGHHEDYSKPFDVKWLCDKCHRSVHVVKHAP